MPLVARRGQAARPRLAVGRVVEAARRVGDVEQLLPEVAQLVVAVLVVEVDQVAQGPHRRAPKAGQVGLDVDLELGEQDGQLVVVDRRRVGRLDRIDERRTERSHHLEGPLRDGVEPGVGGGVPGEQPPVDPDPRPAQRPAPQERPVVAREAPAADGPERRAQHVERDRRVGHGAGHRAGGVLAVGDRDDAGLGDQPDRRLEPDDRVAPGRADDRAVGLGPDRDGAQVGRRRHRGAGARPARIQRQAVRVAGEASPGAPAVEIEAGVA